MKNVGYVQFSVVFGQREANFARVENLMASHERVDLIVLPELAFTGYEFTDAAEAAAYAEPAGTGPTAQFLRALAARHQAVVIAGYPELAGDTVYNSAMAISPTGETLANYRKIHLFSRENDLFTPGNEPPRAFDSPAGRIGIMICFDWFFPEVARALALDGAQVIAHPSNLVLPWCQRAMFARSIENHIFTVTCNRIGTESRAGRELTFTGGSQVLDFHGTPLATSPADAEAVGLATVDLQTADQKQINPHNHLLNSRRPELYNLA